LKEWPKADEIRWAQWRARERKALEEGKIATNTRIEGKSKLVDYQAWLLREKNGFSDLSPEAIRDLFPPEVSIKSQILPLSFQKIGDLLFPKTNDPDNRKKRAADARNRVESEFGRGSLKRRK